MTELLLWPLAAIGLVRVCRWVIGVIRTTHDLDRITEEALVDRYRAFDQDQSWVWDQDEYRRRR